MKDAKQKKKPDSVAAGPAQAKKRMTGPDRRSQIVGIAMRLFSEGGFKGTTTREIAKEAGISEAVIYKHFSKKEDLYKAIIDSRCSDRRGQSMLASVIEGKKGRVVFRELASYLIDAHRKDPSFLRLLTYSALEKHDLSEIFIKTKGLELIDLLETQIRQLIAEGMLRKMDPYIAARAFMGMVLHYSVSQELYGLKRYFKRSDDDVIEVFVDIFFEGMKRRQDA